MFHVEHSWIDEQNILLSFLRRLGEEVSAAQLELFRDYCAAVRTWGQRRNLLSRNDLPHFVDLHVCDSLSALPLLDSGPVDWVMDLGSGAGLPGIPLAIMRPSVDFVLVDARLSRIEFLEVAVRRLELARVHSVRAAANELGAAHLGRYDIVLARAVKKLPDLVPLVAPCLGSNGSLIAYKGPTYQREVDMLPRSAPLRLREVRETELPGGHGRRYLLVLGRIGQEAASWAG
jgi:16S rRNA (guanine527-N7)-methyltransferase